MLVHSALKGSVVKKLIVIMALLAVGSIYFYNTNWFQSSFIGSFYDPIAEVPLDVTMKGERISIPLKYEYETCYDLGVKVPGRELFVSRKTGKGLLKYKFVSDWNVVAEGITHPTNSRRWDVGDEMSVPLLLVFDLPFPGAANNLMLELEVVEAFSYLEEYKGQTSIIISPNYEPKVGKCYNENLRIE